MRDDVPRSARQLTEHEIDIAAARDRAQRFDDDFGGRLEHNDRTIEECQGRVRARGRADRVSLLHEIAGGCGFVSARAMANVDGALEDREVRTRRNDSWLRKQNAGPRRDEEECRRKRRDECERASGALLFGKRRYRDERHEPGRMGVLDRVANFGEGRCDDLELDASEHVFRFALGRFVKRIGHREGRGGESELDEGHGAELAESARKLTYDGGLGCDADRGDRVAARASNRVRERFLGDKTGAEDRVR